MMALIKEDLSVIISAIEDPRLDRRKLHPLGEIIFLAIFGALRGIESWRGLEILGENCIDFLRKFYPYKNGIPSHQTISRVFSLLRPKDFEKIFSAWAQQLQGSNEQKQLAIDGKSLKGTFGRSGGKSALHLLDVCAVESGLCLAQLEVESKINEMKVVPEYPLIKL